MVMTLMERRTLQCLSILGMALCLSGCKSPLGADRKQVREERIHKLFQEHAYAESNRPRQMQWSRDIMREMDELRAEQLGKTVKKIDDRAQYDKRHWRETGPVREAWLRDWLKGRPEPIPDTFAKVWY